MEYCSNFKYDLKVGQEGENLIAKLLKSKKIEVKRDSWVYKSGNIAIEYESRGKPSGISKSEAEWWSIIFSGGFEDNIVLFIESNKLKQICRDFYKKGSVKKMGDNNSSLAVLIPLKELFNI